MPSILCVFVFLPSIYLTHYNLAPAYTIPMELFFLRFPHLHIQLSFSGLQVVDLSEITLSSMSFSPSALSLTWYGLSRWPIVSLSQDVWPLHVLSPFFTGFILSVLFFLVVFSLGCIINTDCVCVGVCVCVYDCGKIYKHYIHYFTYFYM